MILALLEGRKTATRRVVKLEAVKQIVNFVHVFTENKTGYSVFESHDWRGPISGMKAGEHAITPHLKVRFAKGDRLWVKETCRAHELESGLDTVLYEADKQTIAIENTHDAAVRWNMLNAHRGECGAKVPGIFMPRWASRITLTVTDVRVQKLQEITEEDAIAEGIERQFYTGSEPQYFGTFGWKAYDLHPDGSEHPHNVAPYRLATRSYQSLWDSINAKRGYDWESNPWVCAVSFTTKKGNIDDNHGDRPAD